MKTQTEIINKLDYNIKCVQSLLMQAHFHVSIKSPMSDEHKAVEAALHTIQDCLILWSFINCGPVEAESPAQRES